MFKTSGSRPTLKCGISLTKQAMRDESDINNIMEKFQKTGIVNFLNKHDPQYIEIDEIDFQTAMDTINQAQQTFDEMPSSMRKKFGNSPANFLEFIHDPKNTEEIYALGLARKPSDSSDLNTPPSTDKGTPETTTQEK